MQSRNLIAKRVALRRKQLGLTQLDLSRLLSRRGIPLDRAAVAKIENQLRFVRDYELVALAKALQTNTVYLLIGRKQKK